MADFIGIDVTGLENLRALLAKLPPMIQDAVVDAVSKYLINVFKNYPGRNYITRKAAYGKSFFTAKQRRWFFANLNDGSLQVPYRRTQATAQGWRQIGSGAQSIIANETPGAAFTMGPGTQSRHELLVGWKTVDKIAEEREAEIDRRAEAAAQNAIHKAGA